MNSFDRTVSFLKYYIKGGNRHDLHSPFMYQMNEAVIRKDRCLPDHVIIENIREELLSRKEIVPAEDYGAGSRNGITQRSLAEIVKSSSKSPRYARLLYRLVNFLKPAVMLELGTAAGISAFYQCKGNPGGKLITIEGNHYLAEVAAIVLQHENAEVVAGSFEEVLPAILNKNPNIQYVFMDGNHRYEPLLRYFNQVFPKLDREAVIVVDDINWSREMQHAWNVLKADRRIQVSVDLYQLGLLFIRPGLSRQEYTIRY